MGQLKYLMIHCTATPEGKLYTGEQIRKMHCDPPPRGRGWKQVGYSDIIHQDGVVENLVTYDNDSTIQPREITNGSVGRNSETRHVAYIGGVTVNGKHAKDTRTIEQYHALKDYVYSFLEMEPDGIVMGHNQVASKACPSFDVPKWLAEIGVQKRNIYSRNLYD
jgi:N-acetylmuramoyl-L-alanine amidase